MKIYIGVMRSHAVSLAWVPILAAGALAWPGAQAQGFAADYGLSRPGVLAVEPAVAGRVGMFNLGRVRINPAFQSDPGYSGAGLSLEAGRNWFAQVGFGRSLQLDAALPGGPSSADVLKIGGGYRWNNGQSLSLQLDRGRASDRLGLSVSYDWPRYFVRLSYDSALLPAPQDSFRFSAGVRF